MTSLLGLSTYAYFWRMSRAAPAPMTLDAAMRDAAGRTGIDLFQVCDHPPLTTASDDRLAELRALAEHLDLTLEIGTRGTRPEHLLRFLHIARRLGARLVRSMWSSGDDLPDARTAEQRIRAVLPHYERAAVTLALETYEVVPTSALVQLAESLDSPWFGICLDAANTVANLELPVDVVAATEPHIKNWHVKDAAFTRAKGWVGFQYTGVPIGTGCIDHRAIYRAIRPDERDINRVIEFWLPWQEATPGEDAATTTVRVEDEWTTNTIDYLREKHL